ncbi:MAG: hypothetical protein ACR2PI_23560, partial [Hyphomicrobiaceae bacterium]
MGWQFDELLDLRDTRRKSSVLQYRTDGVAAFQVLGVCSQEPETTGLVTLALSADVGRHADGAEVKLHLAGPAFDHQATGYVTDALMRDDGSRSVLLQVRTDDPIWTGLLSSPRLNYRIPGNAAAALPLGDGASKIRAFLDACQPYQQPGPRNADAGRAQHNNGKANVATAGRRSPLRQPASLPITMTDAGAGHIGNQHASFTDLFDVKPVVTSYGPPEPEKVLAPPLPAKVANRARLVESPRLPRLKPVSKPTTPARLGLPPLPGQVNTRISRSPSIEPPPPPPLAVSRPDLNAP